MRTRVLHLIVFVLFLAAIVNVRAEDGSAIGGSDTTKSGIAIEVLQFGVVCSGQCTFHTNRTSHFDFLNVGAVVRFTNNSDKDPKYLQPCNLAIDGPTNPETGTREGEKTFGSSWAYDAGDGVSASRLSP